MTQELLKEERTKQQCDLLEKTWETLNEISADLTNRGVVVTPEIYTSLRTTRALITQCQSHPNPNELTPREIDSYLASVLVVAVRMLSPELSVNCETSRIAS